VGLDLPGLWRITKALVTPEVQTTIREGERQWVAAGETRHVVFDPSRRVHADLVVRAIPSAPRRPLRTFEEQAAAGIVTVAGHAGEFQIGRRRSGWLSRRLVSGLQMRHYCDRTQRTILVDLSGAVALDDLRALLEALGRLECHGPAEPADPSVR
jgi:hypothetical protein